MNRMEAHEFAEVPIACTLGADDGGERLARWRALWASGIPSVGREADALVVTFPAGRRVREELEALAAAERRCCAFAEWEVEPEVDHVVLRIRSHPDGLAALSALFGVGSA
jgi:hypothetical protein